MSQANKMTASQLLALIETIHGGTWGHSSHHTQVPVPVTIVLDDVVNNGEVGQNGNNIEITKDGYRVVLAQEGNGKKWVLTAFDNSKTKKEKLSSANTPGTPIGTSGSRAVAADDNTSSEAKNSTLVNTTDTGKTSERGKRNDTATPQSTVSEGKDSNNSYSLQEKEEKSAKINTSDPMEAIKQAAEAFREERTLMGVHNISEDKLKKALKQVGWLILPWQCSTPGIMPKVAVGTDSGS